MGAYATVICSWLFNHQQLSPARLTLSTSGEKVAEAILPGREKAIIEGRSKRVDGKQRSNIYHFKSDGSKYPICELPFSSTSNRELIPKLDSNGDC